MLTLQKLKMKKSKNKVKEEQPSSSSSTKKPERDDSSITETDDVSDDSTSLANTADRRGVQFSPFVYGQAVMNRDDYSESERKQCWYDKSEKAEMEDEHDKMVCRYEAGKPCEEGMTYRGLDAWTDKGVSKQEAIMDQIWDAVMHEQDEQWSQKTNDLDRLARAARSVSKRRVLWAIKTAQEDEYEANTVYRNVC